MTIRLTNGVEIQAITVNGTTRHFQGQIRDSLEIQLAKDTKSFDELDLLFADSNNTKVIKLIDGETEYIHDNYTLRVEMSLKPVVITNATSTTAEVTEERYSIILAQKTYIELQLDAILNR
ncbi:MAG: hypothetical protein WAX04_04600 [Oscillospiraceae bacterium]